MDISVFGSFSSTSFIDLAQSHKCSWHTNTELLELHMDGEQFNVVTRSSDISNFVRKHNDSYLFGISWDANTDHGIVVDIAENGSIIVNEEFKIRKKLIQFEVLLHDGELVVYTSEKDHLYVDEYLSLSSIPLNNYYAFEAMVEYNLDVHEVSWKSFGNQDGYGSRNRIKKELYPRYQRKVVHTTE